MTLSRHNLFIGLAVGLALSLFVVTVLVAIISLNQMEASKDSNSQSHDLPLAFASNDSRLASYGTPDWDWTLTSLSGQTTKFSEFRGNVVFINFWATWCIPCRAELPSIQRLYDETKGKPFRFALISEEDAGTVRQYMDEMHFTFPAYVTHQTRPRIFEDQGIPVTFIMRPDGEVAYKHDGPARWDWDGSIELLESLSSPVPESPALPR